MPKYDKRVSSLEKIITYCDKIYQLKARFGKSQEAFLIDFAYQNAVAMCLLQIGEHASRLNEEFYKKYDEVPWVEIRGLRNVLAHEYENANYEELWSVVEWDVPKLKSYCEEILAEIRDTTT